MWNRACQGVKRYNNGVVSEFPFGIFFIEISSSFNTAKAP